MVVRDAPGFLVNRVLAPFMNESSILFEEGVGVETLDRAMRTYGMPMGPFELIDEIGTDVAEKVGHILHEGLGEHMKPSTLAGRLVQSGRLGKKSGAGMYRYEDGKRKADASFWDGLREGKRASHDVETLRDRVFGLMLNEAARCLDEAVVQSPGELDLALVFGIGFPPFRGGLLRDADVRGLDNWVQRLDDLAARFGPRFEPCERLRQMAAAGATFYGRTHV